MVLIFLTTQASYIISAGTSQNSFLLQHKQDTTK